MTGGAATKSEGKKEVGLEDSLLEFDWVKLRQLSLRQVVKGVITQWSQQS